MLKKLKRLWFSEMKKAASAQRKRIETILKVFRTNPSATTKAERRSATTTPSDASKPIGAWVSGHLRHGSGLTQRIHYRLFLPCRPEAAMPLVVMLHGCQQNAAEFAQGTDMNVHAAKRGGRRSLTRAAATRSSAAMLEMVRQDDSKRGLGCRDAGSIDRRCRLFSCH